MNVALPLAEALRQATRAEHHRLDHHPLLAPLVRADIDPARYGDALAGLHGAQAATEAALIAGLARLALDYPLTPRLPDLEADLASLGRAPWPLRAEAPAVPEHPAALVGALYVLEGALMGARLIARQLAAHLPQAPLRYFGHGALAPRWPQFLGFAAGVCPQQHHDQACAAARATFKFYRHHLDRCLAAQRHA